MKRKSFLILFLIVALLVTSTASASALQVVDALGDYPRPPAAAPSVAKSLKIDFTRASESLMKNQPVVVEICITNVPENTTADIQWTQDKTPLTDGFYSSVELYDGIKISYQGLLPYYTESGSTYVGVEISVDGIKREELIAIAYKDGVYVDTEAERVLSLVQPMKIPATVTVNCSTYADKFFGKKIGTVASGTSVYYYDHYMVTEWKSDGSTVDKEIAAYIQLPDGSYAWVAHQNVRISTASCTQSGDYTQAEKETFVDAKGYRSDTDYLVWINPVRQKVNVFMGTQYNWSLIKSFTCSTGANKTPTPMGNYKLCGRQDAWIKPTYQVRPILYFELDRGLAFHSRLYSPDGSYLTDATIGRPASHGCIRMLDEDIRWMELMLPLKTTVIVY